MRNRTVVVKTDLKVVVDTQVATLQILTNDSPDHNSKLAPEPA